MEAGVDSLGSAELRRSLADAFFDGVETALPATLMFDYPTVELIAQHIFGILGGEEVSTVSDVVALSSEELLFAAGAEIDGERSQAIAVVSMACHFPGGCTTTTSF